ncbi:quercetin 2,3-dioxygenase [Steroidobacter agaridevorans]|uniref:Quercetin 2,3-dioxygenase n=2 Tax=Steroidobacter agaridevorans TaxID=2695856 RepID=A0A829YCW0_9GAMM|nr:quercetin 2,3-dioxygenase [Steroidobacter agaridevorans]
MRGSGPKAASEHKIYRMGVLFPRTAAAYLGPIENEEPTMQNIRRSNERGYADHGWLKSFHTFSFADYYDPRHIEFGALRVINEDRVAAGAGFGTHGHRDMEIISYVLDGELAHKDSMGTGETIRPGDVQRMSAGRGVTHSEFNPSREKPVHFLQIWIQPNQKGVQPSYEQKHFPEAEKRGKLRLIASPDGANGSVSIHQDAKVYAGLLDGDEQVELAIAADRQVYLHVARGKVTANGNVLNAGDALALTDTAALSLTDGHGAEVIVFDLQRASGVRQ